MRTRNRWLFLAGGALLLGLLLVVGVFVVRNLIDGESVPTPVVQTQATPATVSQAQATTTEPGQPAAVPSPGGPEPVQVSLGPSTWTNGNFVYALAGQGNTLWAGGDGGLVRWDLTDGNYTKLGRADGLASTYVNDLLVDQAGVLWIATDAGINRYYDGKITHTYDEADGLDSSWIQALFLDDEGRLWAGSHNGERGLNYYDGESWGPPPPEIPPLPVEAPEVQAIAGSHEGPLFVGMLDHGLAFFSGERWTLLPSEEGLGGPHVVDLLWSEHGLWVTSGGGVVRFDPQMGEPETVPQLRDLSIYAMHQTGKGELWFAGDDGAMRFDPDIDDWERFEPAPDALPDRRVTDIVEDEDGLWFGTYGGGVAFYDGSDWKEAWTTGDELGGNHIQAIRQDKDGAIWFTHQGTGLSRYDPGGDVWQVFGEAEGALNYPCVPGVDSDGNLWIADSGEMARYDGQGWQTFTVPELVDVEIDEIAIGPDDVQWLVTDHGLLRHDLTSDEWKTFTDTQQLIIEEIWSILAASDGTVWIGGEEGLAWYDGSTWRLEDSDNTPHSVSDIAEAPDGSLWVAAEGEVGHRADGRWSYSAWDSDGWLEWVTVGPDGSVWAYNQGLGRYDPDAGKWKMFTASEGLVHPIVTAIHVTPEGVVWIGTGGGVSRYVPPE